MSTHHEQTNLNTNLSNTRFISARTSPHQTLKIRNELHYLNSLAVTPILNGIVVSRPFSMDVDGTITLTPNDVQMQE
jgi:hypothetical protein